MNVRPIKPHIHANLKFVCTIFVHFCVSVVYEVVWILLSIIVSHKILSANLDTIFFFFFF